MQAIALIANKLLSPVLVLTILLYSCNGRNDTATINALEEGLLNSNETINMSSEMALHALKNKLDDPRTYSKAEIWFPKAQEIQYHSNEMFDFIEGLKKESKPDDAEIFSLYKRLMKYKNDVLATDSTIRGTFNSRIIITTKSFNESKPNIEEFKKTFFNNASKEATSAILTKFQNNIKIIENKLVIYCNERIGMLDGAESFNAIVAQNSLVFKPGDDIIITAGVGSYKRMQEEEISFGGNEVPIEESGLVVYKLQATGIGIHSLPVSVSYLNVDGKKEIQQINVAYTVAKPCDQ